jgi:hypothetical protein
MRSAPKDDDLMFLDDEHEVITPLKVKDAPEPLTRVKVLSPFQVVHDATAYYPNAVLEVPASVADNWLRNRWVTAEV